MKRLDDPFFPVTPAQRSGWLEREGKHRVYWEEAGNPDGLPVVMVHGGPGGTAAPGFRRLCDPQRFRIIQFDQRGCGRSEPAGLLADNSLAHTLADMEALRGELGIERWLVSGGSWGSTVALAYGEAHPERCLALFLVSLWLCRPKDMEWWFQGVRTIFPELWEQFAAPIPPEERGDLRAAYCRRILDNPDTEEAGRFASTLYLYEEGFMRFAVPIEPPDPARGRAYGRIFAHYAANYFFLAPDQLCREAHRVRGIPTAIVTGRYDICTTPDNAWDLAAELPEAMLEIVPGAGHYPTEERLARACVRMIDRLAEIVEQRYE